MLMKDFSMSRCNILGGKYFHFFKKELVIVKHGFLFIFFSWYVDIFTSAILSETSEKYCRSSGLEHHPGYESLKTVLLDRMTECAKS